LDEATRFARLVRPARAILFDFDGILVDSERYHFLAYREVFARYGHRVDEEEYYRTFTSLGLGPKGEIERYGLDLDLDRIVREKKVIFSKWCRDGTIPLTPQARRIVQRFADLGKRLVVASGTSSDDIRAVLERAGLAAFFERVFGKDMVERAKPAPDVYLAALDFLGISPREALVLEDAEKGVRAANAAGIPVIVAKSRETREFDFPTADLVLPSLDRLEELLEDFAGDPRA
jgi:HAD superfamily hydrolase (TIGR01509 family)